MRQKEVLLKRDRVAEVLQEEKKDEWVALE